MSTLRKLRGAIVNKLPFVLRKPLIYKYRLRVPFYRALQYQTLYSISTECPVSVMFLVSSLAMWKYDEIFELLIRNPRFKVNVVLYPYDSYSVEEKQVSIKKLKSFFKNKGIEPIDAYAEDYDIEGYLKKINPKIIFYPMPYEGIYGNYFEYCRHLDKLIIYSPYGIGVIKGNLYTNTALHNLAWRIYVASPLHKQIAKEGSYNNAENVVVVGESNSSRFRNTSLKYPWKKDGDGVKKIIWAPHYSILDGHALHRISFLWLYDFMLHIADKYDGRLQVAFKPHPKLRTLMYQHPDWGKEKTDAYFNAWLEGDNTVIEEGDYAALFATSDAMIHDSSSFIGEYMYTEKPVLFSSRQLLEIRKECNSFGNRCLDLHYHADNYDDITQFIDNVVMQGHDSLAESRHKFYLDVLSFSDGLTTGERIYNDIIKFLGWF